MRVPLTLLMGLALTVALSAQAPGTSGRDEAAVKDLVARYDAARDHEDPAAIPGALDQGAVPCAASSGRSHPPVATKERTT